MTSLNYITRNGKRSLIISVSQRRCFPEDDVLKIVTESFMVL